MPTEYLLIDGKDKVLGRLASQVAKLALLGKHVVVSNTKHIVISGSKKRIFAKYEQKKNIKTRTNPLRGPFYYKRPHQLFRRTVRGMLPFKKKNGRDAFKRVHAYIGSVDEGKYSKLTPYEVEKAGIDRISGEFVTLETLGNRFGWHDVEAN